MAKRKLAEYCEEELKPEPLLTGTDLIGMGYKPGPQFTSILRLVEDAQLEGSVTTRDDAVLLVRSQFPR